MPSPSERQSALASQTCAGMHSRHACTPAGGPQSMPVNSMQSPSLNLQRSAGPTLPPPDPTGMVAPLQYSLPAVDATGSLEAMLSMSEAPTALSCQPVASIDRPAAANAPRVSDSMAAILMRENPHGCETTAATAAGHCQAADVAPGGSSSSGLGGLIAQVCGNAASQQSMPGFQDCHSPELQSEQLPQQLQQPQVGNRAIRASGVFRGPNSSSAPVPVSGASTTESPPSLSTRHRADILDPAAYLQQQCSDPDHHLQQVQQPPQCGPSCKNPNQLAKGSTALPLHEDAGVNVQGALQLYPLNLPRGAQAFGQPITQLPASAKIIRTAIMQASLAQEELHPPSQPPSHWHHQCSLSPAEFRSPTGPPSEAGFAFASAQCLGLTPDPAMESATAAAVPSRTSIPQQPLPAILPETRSQTAVEGHSRQCSGQGCSPGNHAPQDVVSPDKDVVPDSEETRASSQAVQVPCNLAIPSGDLAGHDTSRQKPSCAFALPQAPHLQSIRRDCIHPQALQAGDCGMEDVQAPNSEPADSNDSLEARPLKRQKPATHANAAQMKHVHQDGGSRRLWGKQAEPSTALGRPQNVAGPGQIADSARPAMHDAGQQEHQHEFLNDNQSAQPAVPGDASCRARSCEDPATRCTEDTADVGNARHDGIASSEGKGAGKGWNAEASKPPLLGSSKVIRQCQNEQTNDCNDLTDLLCIGGWKDIASTFWSPILPCMNKQLIGIAAAAVSCRLQRHECMDQKPGLMTEGLPNPLRACQS